MVFEKAWAKLHLSYEDTACGFVDDDTNYLTGCSTNTRIDADPAIFQSIGLISGHAYSILQLKVSKLNGLRYIQIRNPWGNSEWNGDWSDKSPLWTPDLKAEIGYEDEEDGTFWMTWQDYVTWFDAVQTCDPTALSRLTEGNTAQVDIFHSALVAGQTAGGPIGSSTFMYNPTVEMTVQKNCTVALSLYQPDTRAYERDADGNMLDGQYFMVYVTDSSKSTREIMQVTPGSRLNAVMLPCTGNEVYKVTVTGLFAGVECPFWLTAAGQGCEFRPCEAVMPTPQHAQKMAKRVMTVSPEGFYSVE
jgi:hypothetical protein